MRVSILLTAALAGCGADAVEQSTEGLTLSWVDADGDDLTSDVDCDDADPEVGLPTDWFLDRDRDGYGDRETRTRACEAPEATVGPGPADCDDTDPGAQPGADEACDGVDNDCDGIVDEDLIGGLLWYRDADGDGWGDEDWALESCAPPGGYAAASGDCDDADGGVHPGAQEDCGGVDRDCDGSLDAGAVDATVWYADADSDGWGADATASSACEAPDGAVDTPGDCDDADPASNPQGVEVCNGLDEDCDGVVDESLQLEWYADVDGDGYGAGKVYAACTAPPGYTADHTDCDDTSADVSPGAVEICGDATDNDCDGVSLDYNVWYADADGDGWGDPDTTAEVCDAPEGYSADGSAGLEDCDDTRADVHPGAAEFCDGVDTDCDGIEDPDFEWYADADGDGWGDPDSSTWECEVPSGYLDNDGDCDDSDDARAPDNVEVCDGVDNDCDGVGDGWICGGATTSESDSRWLGEGNYDRAGAAVAWVGDTDGDGLDDLLVGAYEESSAGTGAGAAYLVTDAADAGRLYLSAAERFTGEDAGDTAGVAVSGAGDVNGDGLADMLIGARDHDGVGAAYLVLGGTGGGSLSIAEATLLGAESADGAGRAVSGAGDVDGDGHDDLFIGAYASDGAGSNAGAAYLVYGPVSGDIALDGEAAFEGTEQSWAGWSVAGAGDMDGDGLRDLAVGAPEEAGGFGAVWIYQGGAWSGTTSADDADRWLQGEAEGDLAGTAVAGAGDIDGDGLDDLLVGAPGAGAAYLVLGGGSGVLDLGDAAGVFTSDTEGDQAGFAVAGTGDLDGDGWLDLAVGAPGESEYGRVLVVLAPEVGAWSLDAIGVPLTSHDAIGLGETASGGGDADGDGLPELVIGGQAQDEGGTNAGAVFLYRGVSQ